jgi:hypothetical protein
MTARRKWHQALLFVPAVVLLNAAALAPELVVSRVDLNDHIFHFTLIDEMAHAVERGRFR